MNFIESVTYLYSLGNEVLAMKLGLTTTEKLLAALGNLEKNFLKIQVAGTNGKGSTCAFLDAICRRAKINTGLFTSPHLISITERIKINGTEISEKEFAKHATRVRNVSEKLVEEKQIECVPTFFEQMTAIGVSAFAEARIELAILETGLGGRLDSVTATGAEIAAITPIDLDHQQILGDTLTKIAAEKAAIIRADTTKIVLSEQPEEAEKVLQKVCEQAGIAPQWTRFPAEIGGCGERGNFIVNFKTAKAKYENVRLNLPGAHQIENAKLAILLAEILQESNFKITSKNVVEGLQTAEHRGRLEFYQGFLFDGAHNIGGAKALKKFLDEFVEQPITIIFGAMRDKDLSEIARIIFPKAEILIFTKPDNPRSLDASELSKFVPQKYAGKIFEIETIADALAKVQEISPKENLILITGSLYLIGEAQKILSETV